MSVNLVDGYTQEEMRSWEKSRAWIHPRHDEEEMIVVGDVLGYTQCTTRKR